MTHIETDPLRGATLRELEKIFVLDDAGAGFSIETVGDYVPRREDLEHLVEERGRFAHMNH